MTNSTPLGDVRTPKTFFSFPNPVNEWTARTVAAGVFALSVLTLLTGWYWITALLFAGFALRLGWGPKLSPLGRFANLVVAPRLNRTWGGPILVPGPPKRFAQAIGTVVTGAAAIVWFTTGNALGAGILLGIIVLASGLEAFANFCLGCWLFGLLMRAGIIPETVCEACADVSRRYDRSTALA